MQPILKRSHTPEGVVPPIAEVTKVKAPSPQLKREQGKPARRQAPKAHLHRLFNKFHGDGSFDMTYCSWKEIKAEREALNKKLKAETPTRPRQGNVGPSNQHRCH
ncbi:hypothetical protein PSHT_00429 [Puccinia striiformis]|uniref:Uncharacterized protein n=1 Tax=Puccinia striiformis TaxID=27350 RepID=A0A2S4WN72_9BASI|nr:hypothetical protein PSHT_00429 [Puccinia striiformis]